METRVAVIAVIVGNEDAVTELYSNVITPIEDR